MMDCVVRFKSIFIVTLVAFIINATVPFFETYNSSLNTPKTKEISSVFSEKILICTSDGFRWVSLEDWDGNSSQEHPDYECALCYLSSKDGDYITSSLYRVKPISLYKSKSHFITSSDRTAYKLFQYISPSRGPPSIT